jgi:hypothetical protein
MSSGGGTILIACCVCVVCICISLSTFIYPLPTKQTAKYNGYTQIADGRIPYNISNGFDVTNPDDTLCSQQCNDDFTCQGFATWTQDKSTICEKFSSVPNAWTSIPQLFMNKTNGKIFSKNS